MNRFLYILLFVGIYSFSQNTYVPDNNFEQTLIDLGYDSGTLDDYVLTSNINAISYINLSEKNISDLTGIEDFAALDDLDCFLNNLTNLDLSHNTLLRKVSCYSNQLTSLNVNNLIGLEEIWCYDNQLMTIDLTTNGSLTTLSCLNNQLTSLNIDNNPEIKRFWCYNNQISSLNVSNNVLLEILWCSSNLLSVLNVTTNTALTTLLCFSNSIEVLDLNANTSLTYLSCYSNELTTLNLKNGNNLNVTNFNALYNFNLDCIEVDDADWSTTNWTDISGNSSFNNDCENLTLEKFNAIDVSIFPNPTQAIISINSDSVLIKKVELLSASGQLLKNTTRSSITMSSFPVGTYFLRITTDKGLITKKVLKN